MFTFMIYYVLKLLHLETITFSDAMLSDINVVLCYVLSQYRKNFHNVQDSFTTSNQKLIMKEIQNSELQP